MRTRTRNAAIPEIIAADTVPGLLAPGMTVFVAGGANEPLTLLDAIRAQPQAAAGVNWVQSIVPGLNRFDFCSLDETARATAFFITAETRASHDAGRIDLIPCQLRAVADLISEGLEIDLALTSVAAPTGAEDDAAALNNASTFNAGPTCDFVDVVFERARRVVAEVNAALPAPADGCFIDAKHIDFAVSVRRPPPPFPLTEPDETMRAIAREVATLVRDGDTIQTGIGSLPYAVLSALHEKNDLGLHSGIIDDGVMELARRGVLNGAHKSIDRGRHTAAYGFGSAALHAWLGECPEVMLRPVNYTHGAGVLAQIERFVSINSALEVDLAGQVNAETVRGSQIAGTGGAVDFMRGASGSPGGRSIVALNATAARGKVSRIVPRIDGGNATTALRTDIDHVVTEHGVAHLRHLPLRARADALIEIADPGFRDELRVASKETFPPS